MSESFRFPKNPNEGREQTFVDEEGNNPFAEDNNFSEADENVFNSPGNDSAPAYRPEYIATSNDRKGIVFTFGLITLGVGAFSISMTYFNELFQALYVTLVFLNLAMAIPTWMIGYADLRAMRAGALDRAGIGMTRAGTIMSMLTTCVSVFFLGHVIFLMVLATL